MSFSIFLFVFTDKTILFLFTYFVCDEKVKSHKLKKILILRVKELRSWKTRKAFGSLRGILEV